jgi:hypothetical protein
MLKPCLCFSSGPPPLPLPVITGLSKGGHAGKQKSHLALPQKPPRPPDQCGRTGHPSKRASGAANAATVFHRGEARGEAASFACSGDLLSLPPCASPRRVNYRVDGACESAGRFVICGKEWRTVVVFHAHPDRLSIRGHGKGGNLPH